MRTLLLQAFYTVRSERQLMEQTRSGANNGRRTTARSTGADLVGVGRKLARLSRPRLADDHHRAITLTHARNVAFRVSAFIRPDIPVRSETRSGTVVSCAPASACRLELVRRPRNPFRHNHHR